MPFAQPGRSSHGWFPGRPRLLGSLIRQTAYNRFRGLFPKIEGAGQWAKRADGTMVVGVDDGDAPSIRSLIPNLAYLDMPAL